MGEFDGKRVVVCGGSRGIGRSVALGFAEAGAAVSVCARGAGPLEATRAEIAAKGVLAHAAPCDLADGAAVLAYVEDAARALGGIDVLVNNASGFGAPDTEEGWAAGLSVDVMATVRASRAALPHLERTRGLHRQRFLHLRLHALHAHARLRRGEGAAGQLHRQPGADATRGKGIRVNGVAPGSIEFPGGSWEQRRTSDPELYDSILRSHPLRPPRHAGGGGGGGAVPRFAPRALGDGADGHRGWRADVGLGRGRGSPRRRYMTVRCGGWARGLPGSDPSPRIPASRPTAFRHSIRVTAMFVAERCRRRSSAMAVARDRPGRCPLHVASCLGTRSEEVLYRYVTTTRVRSSSALRFGSVRPTGAESRRMRIEGGLPAPSRAGRCGAPPPAGSAPAPAGRADRRAAPASAAPALPSPGRWRPCAPA